MYAPVTDECHANGGFDALLLDVVFQFLCDRNYPLLARIDRCLHGARAILLRIVSHDCVSINMLRHLHGRTHLKFSEVIENTHGFILLIKKHNSKKVSGTPCKKTKNPHGKKKYDTEEDGYHDEADVDGRDLSGLVAVLVGPARRPVSLCSEEFNKPRAYL